ncbi:Hypothetical predicted protein [Olea europaea subsp. europaea]|uniref:Uncharacterized protein n=1 Tax=Olea europaea subsp. europaea TaxID=158383 RepID=A0A8S0S437_OLEEU|nr:Hypothetical predicted protein [Olea europaea subsp. europaea]
MLKYVTHENIKDAFLGCTDISDEDVSMLGALYFKTSYLHPRDYKKAMDHFLFILVEDFSAMNVFPLGKSLFDTVVNSLRERLSKRSTHYRLRGLLVAFQVWIYKTIPSLDGYIARRISRLYPRIMNWAADDHPSAAKLEGLECFSNPDVWYEKPVPPDRSQGEKRKGGSIDRSVHHAGTSTKPSNSGMKQSTMLLITDGRLGHSDLPIDDDDFVDPPLSWKGTSIHDDSPSGERKSDNTTDSEDMPSKDVVDELRNYFKGQIFDLHSENRLLSKQLQAMQSQVSSLKSDQQKKLKLLVRI